MPNTYNDTLVGSLRRQIEEQDVRNSQLELALAKEHASKSEKIEELRSVLIDSIQSGDDATTVINSVADIFDIELTKDITVSIPITLTATLTVPVDFELSDLDITDVSCDAWNTEVENFNVESWDVDWIHEI